MVVLKLKCSADSWRDLISLSLRVCACVCVCMLFWDVSRLQLCSSVWIFAWCVGRCTVRMQRRNRISYLMGCGLQLKVIDGEQARVRRAPKPACSGRYINPAPCLNPETNSHVSGKFVYVLAVSLFFSVWSLDCLLCEHFINSDA